MRKLLITTMAVGFALCIPTQSNAEPGKWRRGNRPRVFRTAPRYNNGPGPLRQMFSNLMELERKKNAWFASTFLGR